MKQQNLPVRCNLPNLSIICHFCPIFCMHMKLFWNGSMAANLMRSFSTIINKNNNDL